ncbi:hypothetical protein GQ55_6G179700 [Panicum hallii var. hallii]|uniref:Uncharacterized protein n=1 Tax=Panicum hallii var. hallii TaxID=1504633 RepID=A0A2T7D739_9POAL|nr:hypothetical protein GQ55_6G179700 [Panicum hallii var. hallii]
MHCNNMEPELMPSTRIPCSITAPSDYLLLAMHLTEASVVAVHVLEHRCSSNVVGRRLG